MFWVSAFLLGLIGSLHCGVMCGPIVVALSSNSKNKAHFLLHQFAYNSGRIVTYLLIGAIVGLIGKGLSLVGFQQILSIVSGMLIFTLYFAPKISHKFNGFNAIIQNFTNFLKKHISPFFKSQNASSRFMIGMINGFLPCGLVYIAAAGAIATGEPLDSAIFMVLFGLGTVPMLFGISVANILFHTKLKFNASKVIPIFVATISILFILRGLNLGIPYVSPKLNTISTEIQSVCE